MLKSKVLSFVTTVYRRHSNRHKLAFWQPLLRDETRAQVLGTWSVFTSQTFIYRNFVRDFSVFFSSVHGIWRVLYLTFLCQILQYKLQALETTGLCRIKKTIHIMSIIVMIILVVSVSERGKHGSFWIVYNNNIIVWRLYWVHSSCILSITRESKK